MTAQSAGCASVPARVSRPYGRVDMGELRLAQAGVAGSHVPRCWLCSMYATARATIGVRKMQHTDHVAKETRDRCAWRRPDLLRYTTGTNRCSDVSLWTCLLPRLWAAACAGCTCQSTGEAASGLSSSRVCASPALANSRYCTQRNMVDAASRGIT